MFCIEQKNIIRMLIGGVLVGSGIGICNATGFGADPLTVLYAGYSKYFNVSISNASWIVAFISVILALLIDKNQIGIATFITPFLTKFGIELSERFSVFSSKDLSVFFFLIGILTIALGIATTIRSNLGKGSNDALISAIAFRLNRNYFEIRWILDILYLVLGVLMGGAFTVGTVVSIIVLGKIIEYFTNFQFKWKKVS